MTIQQPARGSNITASAAADLTDDQFRAKCREVFKKQPCNFQIKLYRAQRQGKNIISVARTGSGKTLTYLLPLVVSDDGIIIIVTALNILGEQFVTVAEAAGFSAISVNGKNDADNIFADIKNLKYRVVIFSPDIMMKCGGRCESVLWPCKTFTSKVQRIIFDEAHCIIEWGEEFRPEYKAAANIPFYLPNIPIYLSSATMSPEMIVKLKHTFHLNERNTLTFRRSNDRPNIAMVVRPMKHPQGSYEDLAFLVPKDWKSGEPPPPKFMVFFNNKKEAEAAAKFLQSRISVDLRVKVPWFHAGMTRFFRDEEVVNLRDGANSEHGVWGFAATDSGGMGLDISDVEIVVQWKVPDTLNTLIQRFGRAARDMSVQGFAILIAEPGWFYEEQLRLHEARKRRLEKRKAKHVPARAPPKSNKRPCTSSTISPSHPAPIPIVPLPSIVSTPIQSSSQSASPPHPSASVSHSQRPVSPIPSNILSPSRQRNKMPHIVPTFESSQGAPIAAPVFMPASAIQHPKSSEELENASVWPQERIPLVTSQPIVAPSNLPTPINGEILGTSWAVDSGNCEPQDDVSELDAEAGEESDLEDGQVNFDDHDQQWGGTANVVEPLSNIAVTEEQVAALLALSGTSTSAATPKSGFGKNTRPPRVPDRAMCMFINAHNLLSPLHCRRYHANLYYRNNDAEVDSAHCCARCAPTVPLLCCDLCHRLEIEKRIPVRTDQPPPRPRKPRRVKVDKFVMSPEEKVLYTELLKWRDEVARARFADFEDFGGDVFLHYQIVERIVELAHIHKLKSLDDLHHQTGWCWTSIYGAEVLQLVQKHCSTKPPLSSPFTRAPLAVDRTQPSTSEAEQRAPRIFTCSSCKAPGHRKNSPKCPNYLATTTIP